MEIAKVDSDKKRMDFRLAEPRKEERAKPATRRRVGSKQRTQNAKAQELGEATKKSKSAPKRKARKPADPATKREKGSTKRRKRAENQKNRS